MPICSVADCGRVVRRAELCSTHYKRKRAGCPDWDTRLVQPRNPGAPCSIDTCDRLAWSRGMCRSHHARWYRTGSAMDAIPIGGPPREERFWAKVDVSAGLEACWPWTGKRDRDGYGIAAKWNNGLDAKAHRVALMLTGTSVPSDLVVMHSCHNPPCCNPGHLRAGTPADNNGDKVRAGRSRHSAQARKNMAEARRQWWASLTPDRRRQQIESIKRGHVRATVHKDSST